MIKGFTGLVLFSILSGSLYAQTNITADIQFTDDTRPKCVSTIYLQRDNGIELVTRTVFGDNDNEYRLVCARIINDMRQEGYELVGGSMYEDKMCTAKALGACRN